MKLNKSTTSSSLTLAIAKGRIFEEAQGLLESSGIKILDYSSKSRKLTLQTNHKNLQVLIVRAGDVPTYVDYGAADMGITGKDVLLESSAKNFYEILDRNDSVMRIKTCACTGAAVNYTPQGMWNAYEKGQPVSITLTLRFNELEPVFDTDYDDNYFNYDPQRTDLLPVPMDAVGY